jgi:hypothetical protein
MDAQIAEMQEKMDNFMKENEEMRKLLDENGLKKIDKIMKQYEELTEYEELLLITDKIVETISYDAIQKMPFPYDVSIKILNKAGTKIDIEDKIKYKIPPSKIIINPFHKKQMDEMLNARITRFKTNISPCFFIHYSNNLFIYYKPEEHSYNYRIKSTIRATTYKME